MTIQNKKESELVELKIALNDIPKLDVLSPSDPQVFLFLRTTSGEWSEIPYARTELIKNEHNPKFQTPLILEYRFEELQEIRVVAVDVDKFDDPDWRSQDFIGEMRTDIGTILGKSHGIIKARLTLPSAPSKFRGNIIVAGRKFAQNQGTRKIAFKISGSNISFSRFQKNDVFYQISRKVGADNERIVICRSGRSASKDPNWSVMNFQEKDLYQDHVNERYIILEFFQHKRHGEHKNLGEKAIKVSDFIARPDVVLDFPLTSAKGTIHVECSSQKSFLDYVEGGLEVQLMVAVDFTASNRSGAIDLHKISTTEETNYEKAIRLIGTILESYDADGKIPVYGFGGIFYGSGSVSHNFPLNNRSDPEVDGVSEILKVYRRALRSVILSGPTNFAPIIRSASVRMGAIPGGRHYGVLLIVTDGQITDMEATVQEIMQASRVALSILIIGVGNRDFGKMHSLASSLINYNWGNLTPRDIVDFVEMKKFLDLPDVDSALPRAVLREIPLHIMEYFAMKEISPSQAKRSKTFDELFTTLPAYTKNNSYEGNINEK